MSTRSAKKWLVVTVVWLVVFGSVAVAWRYIGNRNGGTQTRGGGTQTLGGGTQTPDGGTQTPIDDEFVMTKTVRFTSGKKTIDNFYFYTIDNLAKLLVDDTELTLRIVGHYDATGSQPDGEMKLAMDQISELKRFICDDKGIDYSRISLETNAEGAMHNVATCEVYRRTK